MRSIHGPARLVPLVAVAAGLRLGPGSNISHDENDIELDNSQDTYYWPSARGRVNNYGRSPYFGPEDLTKSLAWEWHHPSSRYNTFTIGALIDDRRDIYLAAEDALRKFNVNGDLLWKWSTRSSIPTTPCLYKGAVYGTTTDGHFFALSMLTGKELWYKKLAFRHGPTGQVQALHDVVILASNAQGPSYANQLVVGFNSTDGRKLWEFQPDAPVWNFMALFVGEKPHSRPSFVFQDMEGKAYRNTIATGELRWKNGGRPGTWTDGSVMYSDHMVFSVALHGCCCGPCQAQEQDMNEKTQGTLTAFRIHDGSILWQRRVWRPPNTIPAVGKLRAEDRPVIVMPIGKQCGPLVPSDVFVYDAINGRLVWHLSVGRNPHLMCAGDLEGMEWRRSHNKREHCNAPPWSAPTIDGNGTIYIGSQDGHFYKMTTTYGDYGGGWVTSKINTGSAFTAPGPAVAPGLVAIASCDGLYVFTAPVSKADKAAIRKPTTRAAADEKDLSPAAIFASKAGALMGEDPEARARLQQQMEDSELDELRKKERRERMTGRIELTRPAEHVDGNADDANLDDTEEGDDEGLPEGLLG